MQYYAAKILIHFKSSKVKIVVSNIKTVYYKIKLKINASLVTTVCCIVTQTGIKKSFEYAVYVLQRLWKRNCVTEI